MVKRKPRALTRDTRQTGSSDMARDKKRKAIAPGKRRSKKGNIYYENRKNRSDVKGRDTPTSSKKKLRRAVKANSSLGDKVLTKVKRKKVVKTTVFGKKQILSEEYKRRALTQYNINEAKNHHTENAVMLVNLFGTPLQKKKARSLMTKINKRRTGVLLSEQKWFMKFGHSHYKDILPKKRTLTSARRASIARSVKKLDRKLSVIRAGVSSREPHEGMRKHKMMPLALRSKIPKLYSTDGKKDKKVWAKYFSPYSQYTLYVVEFDGKDTLFGYVTGMGSNEWGYSSLKEISSASRGRLPLVERDKWFTPKMFSKVRK